MSSSRPRGPLRFLLRLALFGLVFGGVAEVWLRTVMPACETPLSYQQQPDTVFRYDPSGPAGGLFTVGRLCRPGGQWRINNAGWNSAVDYAPASARRKPLVALFGDSFIEGFLTDADQHVDAYLPRLLPGTASYAFGLSGWYLEQYVAVSRYARDQFQPDIIVVFLDAGDVRDSLVEYGTPSPNWWQIRRERASFTEVAPTAVYSAGRKATLSKKSAVLNYLRYNAKVTLPGMAAAGVAQPAAVAGAGSGGGAAEAAAAAANTAAVRDLLPAADYLVGRLCAEHPGTPIVFAAYGDRYLPPAAIARTPLFPDAGAVAAATVGRGQCSFLDLRSAFSRDWAAHRVRFEASDGGHWNASANRLVARTLAEFIARHRLLPKGK